jgi:mRNA interferase MazF
VFDVDVPVIGRHPVVVVSRQEAIPVRTNVTVAIVTSSVLGHPAEVPLNSEAGLDHPSVANCDELYTIPKRALGRKRGELRYEEIRSLDEALAVALGLG